MGEHDVILAGLEHFRARGAFGIFENPVLRNDERTTKRDHHEDPEKSTENRYEHDSSDLQIESENHDRRHRDADSERDRLTCGSSRLNDVVLEDR
mgnify:CR=1 FL=1